MTSTLVYVAVWGTSLLAIAAYLLGLDEVAR